MGQMCQAGLILKLMYIKANSLAGETVNVWCFKNFVSVAADVIRALLIGNNEQEVWLLIGHRQSPRKE